MTTETPTRHYTASAHTTSYGIGEVATNKATIPFDGSWPNTDQPSLPGPGELLAAAFAARAIKNIERFFQVLPFAYDTAEIDVELHRKDQPAQFDRIEYILRIATNEPAARVDLLSRNLAKHGTVYNTLAAGCEISGQVVTTPPTGETTSTQRLHSDANGSISS